VGRLRQVVVHVGEADGVPTRFHPVHELLR
jgi:hypothetical protein